MHCKDPTDETKDVDHAHEILAREMWINIAGIQIARRSKRLPQIDGRTNDWDMIAIERGVSIRDSPSCQWAEADIFFG